MLVVSRKPGECIHIGEGVSVTVVEIKGSKIRLGVTAGKETTILRGEICDSEKTRADKVA
ncbi:MAG: carbon storage regulator [Thermoguttaceae bacterium]